jgi:hypothetical protein
LATLLEGFESYVDDELSKELDEMILSKPQKKELENDDDVIFFLNLE